MAVSEATVCVHSLPPGQVFGSLITEGDPQVCIGRDDCLSEACERYLEPVLLLLYVCLSALAGRSFRLQALVRLDDL